MFSLSSTKFGNISLIPDASSLFISKSKTQTPLVFSFNLKIEAVSQS
jgi:hypothetical protein